MHTHDLNICGFAVYDQFEVACSRSCFAGLAVSGSLASQFRRHAKQVAQGIVGRRTDTSARRLYVRSESPH